MNRILVMESGEAPRYELYWSAIQDALDDDEWCTVDEIAAEVASEVPDWNYQTLRHLLRDARKINRVQYEKFGRTFRYRKLSN